MRTLIIGAALATLIASPAFAQAYGPYGSGNIVFPPGASNDGSPLVAPNATDSASHYAYEPGPASAPEHTPHVQHSRLQHHVRHAQRDDTRN
jgi:hypothetical protein